MAALELLSQAVYHVPKTRGIPVRGKHLDHFSMKDWLFISVNKCMTGIFVYLYFGYLWSVRRVEEHKDGLEHGCCAGGKGIWKLEDLSFVSDVFEMLLVYVGTSTRLLLLF